jgi:hypothetical protein
VLEGGIMKVMPYLPSAVQKTPQINAILEQVRQELAPGVVYIRFEIGQDWSGDWAIFFRVVLSDEASRRGNLRTITNEVVQRVSERVDFAAIGVIPYFNFRSQSEQAVLREPAWA